MPQFLIFVAVLVLLATSGCQDVDVATVEARHAPFVKRVTAEGILTSVNSTPVSVPADVRRSARLSWVAPDGIEVRAGDVVARFDAAEIALQLSAGENAFERNGLQRSKNTLNSENQRRATTMQGQVADLELDVAERYQRHDEALYSRIEIIESAIDGELAEERRDHADVVSGIQDRQFAFQEDLLTIEQRQAKVTIDRANDALSALVIRAPHDGILNWHRDWQGELPQPGQSVWRGQVLAEIPDLTTMKARVLVLEADATELEVGKRALVVAEAYPDLHFEAEIALVEPVARRHHRGSPLQYFAIELSIRETDPQRMKPGQRVKATLFLKELEDALQVPRQAILFDNDGPYVMREEGNGFTEERVKLGPRSISFAVIEEGLEAGDRVAVEPLEPSNGRATADATS